MHKHTPSLTPSNTHSLTPITHPLTHPLTLITHLRTHLYHNLSHAHITPTNTLNSTYLLLKGEAGYDDAKWSQRKAVSFGVGVLDPHIEKGRYGWVIQR